MAGDGKQRDELAGKDYWDAHYSGRESATGRPRSLAGRGRALLRLRHSGYARRYHDYLLWDVIYPKYMPAQPGARALEVGSAPGGYLVRLSRTFPVIPYGVERSASGAAANRARFAANHIDPGQVIQADFLAGDFQERYRNFFDIVISRGFVEHFREPEPVVAAHVDVLAPGGRLFVSVPNFQGVNYFLTWLFQRRLLPLHNLEIMRRERFEQLFARPDLERLFCNYYGVFDFGLFESSPGSVLRPLLMLGKALQIPLNAIFRLAFGAAGAESRFTSPYLLYIGVKRG